jgi:hypothetical protein
MEKKQLEVRIDHGREAFYSNAISVIHSPGKFTIDFRQAVPRVDDIGEQKKQTLVVSHSSVLLDPNMAKIFVRILAENVRRYERSFGRIALPKKQAKGRAAEAAESDVHGYIG